MFYDQKSKFMPSANISTRKAPLQIRSKERVNLIIDSAEKMLMENDLANITTSKIAKHAGIPVGSIYQYFGDRDAIFLSLGERVIADEDQKLEAIFDESSANAPWRQVVIVVVRAFLETIYEKDIHFRLDMALANNSEWRNIHIASEKRMIELLSSYPLFSEKEIAPQKAHSIAKVIVLLVTAAATRSKYPGAGDDKHLLITETEAMITAYLSSIFEH